MASDESMAQRDKPGTTSDRPLRPRKIIAKLLLTVTGCLVILTVTEILLRLFLPMHYCSIPTAYRYDPELGFTAKPGEHIAVTDHRQELRVNQLGTVNFQDNFDEYETMVFALGDSYTQGIGNPADDSYPFCLDMMLNRNAEGIYEKKYAIVNLGLSAFGAHQSLLAMERYTKRLAPPRYVLYLGCDNDAFDDKLFLAGYKHRNIVEGSPLWGWAVGPIQWLDNLQIVRRTKQAAFNLMTTCLKKEDGRGPATDGPAELPAGQARSVAELQWPIIRKIADRAATDGGRLIVSWINTGPSYKWARDRAASEGVPFADWYPAVKSVQDALGTLPFANDHSGGHCRPWVMREVAREFAKQIRALELQTHATE